MRADKLAYLLSQCTKEGIFTNLDEWNIKLEEDPKVNWLHFIYKKDNPPVQGYKLHVSASLNSALEVVKLVLPILEREKTSFKITRTMHDLNNILEGKAGLTQVGKFITIYPYNNHQAVNLGTEIHKITDGLQGPHVPYEKALGPRSLVHYRYGAFKQMKLQLDNGQLVNAILDKNGKLKQDLRDENQYSEEDDPFQLAGIKVWRRNHESVLKNRYLRTDLLYKSPKSSCWLGLDLSLLNTVIIKEAYSGMMVEENGVDAKERILHEAKILTELQDFDCCPTVIDSWKETNSSYLILDFIEGTNLKSVLAELASKGISINEKTLKKWFRELCVIIKNLHDRRITHNDLKPDNIIIDKQGHLHILDFELASRADTNYTARTLGTQGYFFQTTNGVKLPFDNDIYSLGAILASMITQRDISLLPPAWNYMNELEFYNHISPSLIKIVDRCLSTKTNYRFKNVDEILELLDNNHLHKEVNLQNDQKIQTHTFLNHAKNIGNGIIEESIFTSDQECFLVTKHPINYAYPARDIYMGNSGIGIFLLELWDISRETKYKIHAEKIANWLQKHNPKIGREHPLPGLYFGEAGVGLFYLYLYKMTNNDNYLKEAEKKSDLVSKIPCTSADIMVGYAGVGLFHLFLARTTTNNVFYERAKEAAEKILDDVNVEGGGYKWKTLSIHEKSSDTEYLGFAHGSAGIAYFLLELYKDTKIECFLNFATKIADWLFTLSHPVLSDGTGLNWPETENGDRLGVFWCHGAVGIGTMFLEAFNVTKDTKYLEVIRAVARTVCFGGKWVGTTQCHGLAGNCEFLIDTYQTTGEKKYLEWGYQLGKLLLNFAINDGDRYKWQSERPDVFTYDYMVGQAGIGSCLLRLAYPDLQKGILKKFPSNKYDHVLKK